MSNPHIIGLAGLAGSGKTTVAEALVHEFRGTRVPFAQALREAIDATEVCGPRDIREEKDVSTTVVWPPSASHYVLGWLRCPHALLALSNEYEHVFFSGRELLQYVGTELVRAADPQAWVRAWRARVEKVGGGVIIADDVRYPNERAAIREMGGMLIRLYKNGQESTDTHASENSLGYASEYDDHICVSPGEVEKLCNYAISAVKGWLGV